MSNKDILDKIKLEKDGIKGGIYKLWFIDPDRCYIGQAVNLRKRLLRYLSLDCKQQSKIHRAILKYKIENIKIEILEFSNDINELNKLEEFYIKKYDSVENGYNLNYGGNNRSPSKETREKLSKAGMGKISKYRGIPLSQQTKDKIEVINQGKSKGKNNTSKYAGVYWDKKRNNWCSKITKDRKEINIGRFKTQNEAGAAYNAKAVELFGENARTNDVPNWKDIKTEKIVKPIKTCLNIGIYFHTSSKYWNVRVKINGKWQYLGSFKTELEAIKAQENKYKEVELNNELLAVQ